MAESSLPIGEMLPAWSPPPLPAREPLTGRTCRLEPLDPRKHADDLSAAHALDPAGTQWTYLFEGPFAGRAEVATWVAQQAQSDDRISFAVVERTSGRALGSLAFMRLRPEAGSIELGCVAFAPELQRTTAATEAVYLTLRSAFTLGYRRFEWKCDALNAASRRAAQRFGFTYEGTFRQDLVYKGRNRDTAWYSVLDSEWPRLARGFELWLDPANFDERTRQRRTLAECRPPL